MSGASQKTPHLQLWKLLSAKHTVSKYKLVNSTPKETCIFAVSHSFFLCTDYVVSLLMSRVLARTYTMIAEILHYEEENAKLKGASNDGVKSNAKTNAEIDRLTKELERKERDFQALKAQAAGTNRAYDELAEAHAKATAASGEPKKDL